VQSANATASRQSDLEAIRALVQSKPGGFEVLDSTVKRHLGKWFVSKGAVRSAERVQRGSSLVAAAERWSGGSERLAISPTPSGYLNVGGPEDDDTQPNGQRNTETSTSSDTVTDAEPHGVWRSSKRVLKGWSGGSERPATSSAPEGYLDVGDAPYPATAIDDPSPISDGMAGAEPQLQVGQRCTVKDRGNGVVRFVGTLKTKHRRLGVRIGVALDTKTGLNDGTADGTRFFECRAGHGIFSHPENVQPVDKLENATYTVFGF
jgi:hypothetical protein